MAGARHASGVRWLRVSDVGDGGDYIPGYADSFSSLVPGDVVGDHAEEWRQRPGTTAGIGLEACNPRHAHEWAIFEDVQLPDEKYVIPGVIDSTTNYIEHPELVAQRLMNYARLVGPERVVAGADCGFGTSVVRQWRVVPSVTWAKLGSLVDGARLASESL